MLWMCSPCQPTGHELFNVEMDPEDAEVAGETRLEGFVPRAATDPWMPTASERTGHAITHIPYRRWCIDCARGRGKRRQHRTVGTPRDPDTPRAAID